MAITTFSYYLNEKGRKESLRSGGNGKKYQEIKVDTDLRPELLNDILEIGSVLDSGDILVKLSWSLISDYQVYNNYSSSPTPYEIKYKTSEFFFDKPQTADELIKFEKERISSVLEKKAIAEAECEKLNEQAKIEREEYNKKEAERKEKEAIEAEKRAIEKKEKEEKEKIQREAFKTEMASWIKENGSDYLKDCVKLGYKCTSKYVKERGALEFGCNILIDSDDYDWEEKVNPSEKRLEQVKELIERKYNAEIVWFTSYGDSEVDYYYNEELPCEKIIIRKYLGKYDIVLVD